MDSYTFHRKSILTFVHRNLASDKTTVQPLIMQTGFRGNIFSLQYCLSDQFLQRYSLKSIYRISGCTVIRCYSHFKPNSLLRVYLITKPEVSVLLFVLGCLRTDLHQTWQEGPGWMQKKMPSMAGSVCPSGFVRPTLCTIVTTVAITRWAQCQC